jgi:hypothetical protein
MRVDLRQVQAILNKIFDQLIEVDGTATVEISGNFYWNLPKSQLCDMATSHESLQPDVGSLSDDWDLLSPILHDDRDPVAYQLSEIAPLLRYLGEYRSSDTL